MNEANDGTKSNAKDGCAQPPSGQSVAGRQSLVLRQFRGDAQDGEVGGIANLLFDDRTWTVRYLVVETGHRVRHRRELLSPIVVENFDASSHIVTRSLTREEIANSPDVDTRRPLSRQMELKYRDTSAGPSTGSRPSWRRMTAAAAAAAAAADPSRRPERTMAQPASADPHLRSDKRIVGYSLLATDGVAGRVTDFGIAVADWSIDYLVVRTAVGRASRTVQIAPAFVGEIDWAVSSVKVPATREEFLRRTSGQPNEAATSSRH